MMDVNGLKYHEWFVKAPGGSPLCWQHSGSCFCLLSLPACLLCQYGSPSWRLTDHSLPGIAEPPLSCLRMRLGETHGSSLRAVCPSPWWLSLPAVTLACDLSLHQTALNQTLIELGTQPSVWRLIVLYDLSYSVVLSIHPTNQTPPKRKLMRQWWFLARTK